MKATITSMLFVCATAVFTASADDHDKRSEREHHNYIIERQQTGQVQGPPTSRIIIGKREIDIYPNGLMFEKNNVVGIRK